MTTPRTPYGEAGISQSLKGWFRSIYTFLESRFKEVFVTSTYTVKATDYFVSADATGGAFTVTLPDVTASKGRELIIKRMNGGGNAVTIGGTVDGVSNPTLSSQYTYIRLFCDGVQWNDVT